MYSAMIERKQRLRAILPKNSQSVLFCDHVEGAGEELFALACNRERRFSFRGRRSNFAPDRAASGESLGKRRGKRS